MTTEANLASATQQIRRRLLMLLLRAYVITLAVSLLLFAVLLAGVIGVAQQGPLFRELLNSTLASYYIGAGSWDDVAALEAQLPQNRDVSELVRGLEILDLDRTVVYSTGEQPENGRTVEFEITTNAGVIGYAVIWPRGFNLIDVLRSIFSTLAFFTLSTGLAVGVLGLVMWRRIVRPVSAVIAGSQAVGAGDLSARVSAQGTGDMLPLVDGFNQMAATLERDKDQRQALMADIAHELRTPLSVIRGRLEGILDEVYPADEAHVAPVLEETYILERLVDDLRLLTLAEARALALDVRPLQVEEWLTRAVDLFQAEAEEKEVSLRLAPVSALPPLAADSQRLGQVVGNLLQNALRYCRPGDRVVVSAGMVDERIEILVADSGPGVSEEALPHLFDRLWRGDQSRNRDTGGAGLGLAIARQLVEAHGGTIGAKINAEGGLTFRLVLPAAE